MSDNQPAESDPRNRWIQLVGNFILAFGDIELVSFILWSDYYPNEKPSHSFKERTTKLLGPLKRDANASQAIPPLLVEALRLADKRNTIARHPLQVQVFQHSITGNIFTELAISSKTTDDYITDEELMRLGTDARKIGSALYRERFPKSSISDE